MAIGFMLLALIQSGGKWSQIYGLSAQELPKIQEDSQKVRKQCSTGLHRVSLQKYFHKMIAAILRGFGGKIGAGLCVLEI